MAYKRPANPTPLSKARKLALLRDYNEHYRQVAATDLSALNRKAPRDAFAGLLDRIGELLIGESEKLGRTPGAVRDFLEANPLPRGMAGLLPDGFRAYCLALNSLKQWVAAEQAASDRYLLGGVARQLCREASDACLVTHSALGDDVELHHPVRDGRPPIPLCRDGHASIEGQVSMVGSDAIGVVLIPHLRGSNRSWAQLRRGCLDLLARPSESRSKASAATARALARKAAAAAGVGFDQILAWLDERGL